MEAPGVAMCTIYQENICGIFGEREFMVRTSSSRIKELAERMQARGIKPEWEVFSLEDMVQDVARSIRIGLDKPPYFINIVLGVNAFQGALPYTPRILQMMVDHLPADSVFNVSAI